MEREIKKAPPKKGRGLRAALIAGACVLALLAVIAAAPLLALPIVVNRHVDYLGVETERKPLQGIYSAADYGLEERILQLTTSDGLTLWCSELRVPEPKAAVICLSGIVQPSVTYFYGHAKLFSEAGYSTLLLEVRSHGSSEGNRIGLGYTEVEDVRAAVEYLKSTEHYRDVPIILLGVSMGGAVALNSFGQLREIDGVIAMSAYSSFEEEVDSLARAYRLPGALRALIRPSLLCALRQLYGREAVTELRPARQIKNADGRPVLLIACAGDDSVPAENSLRLQAACPEAELWVRDSWEHFIVRGCDFAHVDEDTEYCAHLLGFLGQVTEGKGA